MTPAARKELTRLYDRLGSELVEVAACRCGEIFSIVCLKSNRRPTMLRIEWGVRCKACRARFVKMVAEAV